MFHHPSPHHATRIEDGNDSTFAMFVLPSPVDHADLMLIVGTLPGWEYAQVVGPGRCPVWDEMKTVKDLCWDAEDCCLQLHPAQSRYINKAPFSLWIWRPTEVAVPQPPLLRERNNFSTFEKETA